MPREERKREGTGSFLAIVVIVLLVVGAFSKTDQKEEQTPKSAATAPQVSDDGRRLVQARRDVRERLRDPGSAVFSNVSVRKEVVCGFVNSRNGFGGMTGPEPFITRAGVIAAVPSDMPPGDFQAVWDRLC